MTEGGSWNNVNATESHDVECKIDEKEVEKKQLQSPHQHYNLPFGTYRHGLVGGCHRISELFPIS